MKPGFGQRKAFFGALGALGAAALVGLGLMACAASGSEGSPSFETSEDPGTAVLSVQAFSPSRGSTLSMTLFGDGRLEFHRKQFRTPEERSWRLQLDPEEMQNLLQLALGRGLPEWDAERIETIMRSSSMGRVSRSVDGTSLTVTMNLAGYRHGSYRVENLSKTITYANPDSAADAYPGIGELRSLADLHSYLVNNQLRAERVESRRTPVD